MAQNGYYFSHLLVAFHLWSCYYLDVEVLGLLFCTLPQTAYFQEKLSQPVGLQVQG